jgi:hypothetical protein
MTTTARRRSKSEAENDNALFANTCDEVDRSMDLIIRNAVLLMRYFELQGANEGSNRRVDFGDKFGEEFGRAVSKLAEAIAEEGDVVREAAGLLRKMQREAEGLDEP